MSQRGLKNNEQSNTKYLAMSNGNFVKRVKEPTPASKPRKLTKGVNKGKEVHEEHFTEFTGQLISITAEHHEQFGASWAFKFDVTVDEEEFLILKLPYSSGYSNNILTRLPNIKSFDNDLTMSGYCFRPADKDKDVMGISMKEWRGETAEKIIPLYTKDTPNGIPEMKQVVVSGKKVWDDTERMEFLESMVNELIIPKLGGTPIAQPAEPQNEASTVAKLDTSDAELDEDGELLPF